MTILETLTQLNLSPQEAELYLAALEISPASVAQLSKKAGIERTATYPHLEKLLDLGLLTVSPEKGKKLYVAQDPKILGRILDSRKEVFKQVLPDLMSIFNIKGVKPKIRYYEGHEGAKTIIDNSIRSGAKEVLDLTPVKNIMAVLGERYVRSHIDERVRRGIKMRVLRPREKIEGPWEMVSTDKSLLREIRYLPEDFKLDDMIIIQSNIVAIVSSLRENYGLEIESKEFADTMRSFFNLAWEAAGLPAASQTKAGKYRDAK